MATWGDAGDAGGGADAESWGGGGGGGGGDAESWGGGGDAAPVVDDGSDDLGYDMPAPKEEERKPRLSRKAMEKLQSDRGEGKEKFIAIFTRDRVGKVEKKATTLNVFMDKFSREAAVVFSENWRKQLDGSCAALIIDLESIGPGFKEPLKRILEWINMCVDEGNDIKFPEITDTDNALALLVNVIVLAKKLKIPEMSLQSQLSKAAIKYARHSLIDLEHVLVIYNENHQNYVGDDEQLRDAAAASIFEAWWNKTLDDPAFDDYCDFIEKYRVEFPKLDEDINKRYEDKKEYITKKREEKREERRQGGGFGPFGGYRGRIDFAALAAAVSDYPETTGPDGGWSDATAAIDGAEPVQTTEWVVQEAAPMW